jgi:hypothetical protein
MFHALWFDFGFGFGFWFLVLISGLIGAATAAPGNIA